MKLTLKIDQKRNMAYTIHETYVGAQPYNWYNLSRPVGQNATNLYDDVCLVQILLAYLRPYVAVLRDPQLRQIIPDGICGPITQAYIDAYQSHITVRRPYITLTAEWNLGSAGKKRPHRAGPGLRSSY